MARQLIVSIVVFGFFGFAAQQASADNIGVGKPSTTNSTSSTDTEMSADDNIGVGEESWYDAFLQLLESDDT